MTDKALSLVRLCSKKKPFTDKFPSCALHSLRTMCGYRQGIFTVGAASLDHQALGDFISQPDTSLEDLPSTFDDHSWKVAHQITYFGSWRLLPFDGSHLWLYHLLLPHELVGLSQRVLFLFALTCCYDALRLLCLKQDRKLYSFA